MSVFFGLYRRIQSQRVVASIKAPVSTDSVLGSDSILQVYVLALRLTTKPKRSLALDTVVVLGSNISRLSDKSQPNLSGTDRAPNEGRSGC
jgi:hypothetical protein